MSTESKRTAEEVHADDHEAKKVKVESDRDLFLQSYERIKADIVKELPEYELPQFGIDYFKKMMDYNIPGGKLNRGLAVLDSYRLIKAGQELTEEEIFQAHALGWCIEFIQAFFLVADDVMDSSITRRGSPCWYLVKHIGVTGAVNDALLIESFVFRILKYYFGKSPMYRRIIDALHEVIYQTEIGQHLDVSTQPPESPLDFSKFTLAHYKGIVKYKTAFYSFYAPVEYAMILAGIDDEKLYGQARDILLVMGEYFQIQDDYLDCYGKPEDIGKVGTDIQDAKCSWLAVNAFAKANEEQRAIMNENYGKKDEVKVAKIKELYNELGLQELFAQYEEDAYAKLNELIDASEGLPKEMFRVFLAKIFKRKK